MSWCMRCFMLSKINANVVCMRMLWNDAMNELCVWEVLLGDSTGENKSPSTDWRYSCWGPSLGWGFWLMVEIFNRAWLGVDEMINLSDDADLCWGIAGCAGEYCQFLLGKIGLLGKRIGSGFIGSMVRPYPRSWSLVVIAIAILCMYFGKHWSYSNAYINSN